VSPHEMALRTSREASEAWKHLNERLEAESRRLAHALHDEAGQLLASVHIALSEIASDLPPSGRRRLKESRNLLLRIEEELRRISHELRPTVLDVLGLGPALAALAEGVSKRGGFEVKVEGSMGDRLPANAETALYRVVQEALTNVGRHAGATSVTVRLQRSRGILFCMVRDDGKGFDASRILAPGGGSGLGLLGMKERMGSLGGSLSIKSRPGRGTELTFQVPLGVQDAGSNPAGR
jgi:signal transduction histidine kinase